MQIVVTISGNPNTSQRNNETDSAPAFGSEQSPTEIASATEARGAVTSAASPMHTNLQGEAEADLTGASTRLAKVQPKLAERLDLVPSDQTPGAADAVQGLASILGNLDGIVKIVDLLADVSCPYFFQAFVLEISKLCLLI